MKSPCPSRDSRRAASRSAASFQGAPHREIYEEVNNDGGGVFSHYQDRTSSVPVPRPLAKEPPQEPATNGIRSWLSKPCAPHPGVPEDIMYDESKSYTTSMTLKCIKHAGDTFMISQFGANVPD